MRLTREMILTSDDLTREEVEVEEWGGSVFVRVMTGSERDILESRQLMTEGQPAGERLKNLRALLAVLTTCDENGGAVFVMDDMDAVGHKSSKVLDRLFEVSLRLNKLREEEVQQLVGESAGGQSADSGSALP